MIKLDNISFDESDKNLFQVDDARLRADALKHSVVPRLRVVLDNCIAWIDTIYNVDVLEDSRISCFPNFRIKREKEINFLYESAYASLGGKKNKYKWLGMNRKDEKNVQILPFRYGFSLEEEGLYFQIENYWLKGLTDESYRKFFDFHLEYESLIHSLCYQADIKPILYYGYDCEPISTFRDHYKWMAHNRYFDNDFVSTSFKYPISSDELHIIVQNYVFFYPIYDSYIQIALGKPVRLLELVGKLNKWIKAETKLNEHKITKNPKENVNKFPEKLSESDILKAKLAAEQRVKLMPSIRWQVFQRDNWKCVSCGRKSHDDVILHVDHIIPRSKGGKNTLENYQTLCNVCNLGKSNKDSTDLRHTNNRLSSNGNE